MIRVLLVDDHEMVRLGVSSYLSIQSDVEVVGEAENGEEGYEKAMDLRPDVILMDLVMEVMDGIESTKKILKDWPEAKILIVTSFIDDEKVFIGIITRRDVNRHVLHEELTNREQEILLLIAQGMSNQEIADELFITLKTVKTHVSNILAKLEVEDRTQAAIYAFKHGLIK